MSLGKRLLRIAAILIVGFLALVAYVEFEYSFGEPPKEKAYVASMKSDLRNLITAQEAYFSDNHKVYAPSVEALGTGYRATHGVTVTLGTVTDTGWTAMATSVSTRTACRISVGGTATNEGDPVCK